MDIVLIAVITAALIGIEAPGLLRAGRKRDLVAFLALTGLAAGASVAVALGWRLDGFHRALAAVFAPPLAAIRSILAP